MLTNNPYDPPPGGDLQAIQNQELPSTATLKRPPYVWTGVLLVVGVSFLLLLNGREFTNGLIFLGCVAASGVVWMRFGFARNDQQRFANVVLVVHVALMVFFAFGLPAKHRRQQDRDGKIQEFLQRARTTVDATREQP